MARRLVVLVALVLISAGAVPVAARAASGPTGNEGFDRGIEQAQRVGGALCRTPLREVPDPSAPEACTAVDPRPISDARMQAYEASWTHRALTLQRGLDQAAPFGQAQMPHTHNSFNASSYRLGSTSYYPTLTNLDANQVYSLTDQLRMDVRAIEIDLHWWPSPYGKPETGGKWVTMCHGDSSRVQDGFHLGCTWDRPFEDGLAEVRSWLDGHKSEVILLYLENQLVDENGDNQQAHDIAAQLLEQGLGSRVYRPQHTSCEDLPLSVSRQQILDAGAQVMLVGNCGAGGAWGTWVHDRGPASNWDESGNPTTYGDADCARDRAQRIAGHPFRRWYEDSTWVTSVAGGGNSHITPETTGRMVRCGVNIVGFDQLRPDDGRLNSFVWSWAQSEPKANAGSCAYQGGDARFHAGDCNAKKHFACVDTAGAWHVTAGSGKWDKVNDKCATEFPGSHFAVPANGLQNELLNEAKQSASDEVWLAYRSSNGNWSPL